MEYIQTTDKENNYNGWMLNIYKDTEEDFPLTSIRYIYAIGIEPIKKKGPHLHLKRNLMFVPVQGTITITKKYGKRYVVDTISSESPCRYLLQANTPFELFNNSDEKAVVLVLADHPWSIEDKDNHQVDNWHV